MPTPAAASTAPHVKTIGMMQPLVWLVLGWRDIAKSGWISILHGLALTVVGAAIVAFARHRFWLLAGALSGFLVVAPVLATSLYALSRAIERREQPNFSVVLKTWLNWQHSHFNKWDNDYWCMVQFGVLLAAAATGWVLTSAALITLLAPVLLWVAPLVFLALFYFYPLAFAQRRYYGAINTYRRARGDTFYYRIIRAQFYYYLYITKT